MQEEGEEPELSYDTIRIIGIMSASLKNSNTYNAACGGPGLVNKINELRQEATTSTASTTKSSGGGWPFKH